MANNYSTSSISRISSSAIRDSSRELKRQSIRFSKFSKTTKVSEEYNGEYRGKQSKVCH